MAVWARAQLRPQTPGADPHSQAWGMEGKGRPEVARRGEGAQGGRADGTGDTRLPALTFWPRPRGPHLHLQALLTLQA